MNRLYVLARPRDAGHPYGQARRNSISAAVEDIMGLIAGVLIVYNAARNLFFPVPIRRLGTGIYLIAAAAVICQPIPIPPLPL